jgi:hypothetical protein
MVDVSIRGLQESGQREGYPLVRFTGTLDNFYEDERTFGTNITTFVKLQFSDIDVEEAEEPYPFPTAEFGIKYSNYKNSGWGIFSLALSKCIAEDEDIADAVGRRLTMAYTKGHDMGFKDNNWQPDVDDDGNPTNEDERPNVIMSAWEVVAIDGVGAGSADVTDVLSGLLDGKTLAEFNKAALADSTVKAQGKDFIASTIQNKSFVTEALSSGSFTKDKTGVYHAA